MSTDERVEGGSASSRRESKVEELGDLRVETGPGRSNMAWYLMASYGCRSAVKQTMSCGGTLVCRIRLLREKKGSQLLQRPPSVAPRQARTA